MENSNDNEQSKIIENLPKETAFIKSDTDLDKNDSDSLLKHNEQYTSLLSTYVTHTKRSLDYKYLKKNVIFTISMILFVAIPVIVFVTIIYCLHITTLHPYIGVINVLPEIVTAFGALIATYITIVKLITQYLFNKNEEKAMQKIITTIQNYDMHIRNQNKKSDQ